MLSILSNCKDTIFFFNYHKIIMNFFQPHPTETENTPQKDHISTPLPSIPIQFG